MKAGEKRALRLVLILFVGIIGFTVYLEMEYRQSSPHAKTTPVTRTSEQAELQNTSFLKIIIPKGMTANDLPDPESRGATILLIYCAQCHELPTPVMHSALEWPLVLTRMQSHLRNSKNGMLRHVVVPPKKDWPVLEKYLSQHAQIPLDPRKYDDLDSIAGKAFLSICSQCHTAPSPESHTKNEWPRVVLRMKSNMLAANITPPKQETLLNVIDFLQRYSKSSL